MPSFTDTKQTVVKFVQELLHSENDRCAMTPAIIDQKIELAGAGVEHRMG